MLVKMHDSFKVINRDILHIKYVKYHRLSVIVLCCKN